MEWRERRKNDVIILSFAGRGEGSGDPFRAYALL